MARYSAFKYGTNVKYGTSSDTAYSVAPFDVLSLSYDEVFLTWKEPLNPATGSGRFARFRIVRNQNDVPETPEDGVILVDIASNFSSGQKYAIDGYGTKNKDVYYVTAAGSTQSATYLNPTTPLTPGKITYYAAWIMQIDSSDNRMWELVGVVDTLVAKDHATVLGNTDDTPDSPTASRTRTRGTHEKVIDLLPRVFTSATESPMDPASTTSDLDLFLRGFSYTLDEFMTYTDLLLPNHTGENLSPQLLSTRSFDYNLSPNNSDFTASQRRLVRESRHIASHRGTKLGAETAIEATTGYNTEITDSPNIMLSNQDSTFRGGVGNWKTLGNATVTATRAVLPPQTTFSATAISGSGTTITYTCSNNLVANDVVTIIGATTAGYNLTSANVATASASQFTITNSATGSSSGALVTHDANAVDLAVGLDKAYCGKVAVTTAGARLINGVNNPITQGIPVGESTNYTVSYYAKDDASGTTTLSVLWYDYTGTLISTSATSGRSFTSGWVKYSENITSPAGARYAALDILFSAAANYYFDNIQFAVAGTSTFNEARGITAILSPKKVNLIKNPSFEAATTGWTTSGAYVVNSVVPVTAISGNGTTVTYTCANSFSAGDRVTITGSSTGAYNLTAATVASASSTQFTVTNAATGSTSLATATLVDGVPAGLLSGASCMQATVNSSAKKIVTDTSAGIASVTPGYHYTFSVYARATTGTAALSFSISAASAGLDTLTNTTTATATTGWARYYVTLYIPKNYASPTVTCTIAGPSGDTVIRVDAAQLEAKYFPTDYFDGAASGATWTTANNSPSYYYPNKDLFLARLFMDIKDYLPVNTPYVIRLDTDSDPIATVNGTNIAGYTS